VDRTGTGPRSLTALHSVLTQARQRGYAVEDGEVSPGLASVAVAVHDHNRQPIAAVAVTYADETDRLPGRPRGRDGGRADPADRRLSRPFLSVRKRLNGSRR
jgi:DNA-binding IclR family transcriptional regulator